MLRNNYIKSSIIFSLLIMSCENEITINSMGSNQLKNESSLYLKQHSENPVNWQRWSNSIFDFSEELNKLVIVSIGYSSCH